MIINHPGRLILIGFVLLMIGVIFPFLMTLRLIESTFFLNIFSYAAQVSGLFCGLIGAAMYFRLNRRG